MLFGGNPNKSGLYHDTSVILLVHQRSCLLASSFCQGLLFLLYQYSNRLKGLHRGWPKGQPLVQATWGLWSTNNYIGTVEKTLKKFVLLINIHYRSLSQPSTKWGSLSQSLTLPGLSISLKRPYSIQKVEGTSLIGGCHMVLLPFGFCTGFFLGGECHHSYVY
jgi:hypothetical protein